jgi:hypothetical protein
MAATSAPSTSIGDEGANAEFVDAFGIALAILVGVSIYAVIRRDSPIAVVVPNAFGWIVAIALLCYLVFAVSAAPSR